MPYQTRKTSAGRWETYNPDSEHVYGVHDTEQQARAQQAALYVNAPPKGEVSETGYDADSSDDNFAYAPSDGAKSDRVFKIGDAQHVKLAVSAFVNWEFRGNAPKVPADAKPGIKRKIEAAIHKHLTGDEAKYYSKWLSTGNKPDKTSVKETISFDAPEFLLRDEPLYPEVPILDSVNGAELLKGDDDPLFVTRPLGILNATSGNKLVYDEPLLSMIESAIRSKRPVARQGHVPEDDRDWDFPPDQAIWVGVLRDGATLYGKAYILPDTHFNKMVRARKAAGTSLSTSIWGQGSYVDNGDGTVRCIDLDLETIDFVPAERASLQALPGQFETTSEMIGVSEMAEEHSDAAADLDMLKKAIASIEPGSVLEMLPAGHRQHIAEAHIKEMSPEKVCEMLPDAHRKHVAETHLKEASTQEVYEMLSEAQRQGVAETHLMQKSMKMIPAEANAVYESTVSEMKTMKQSIAELQSINRRYERADFERAVDGMVDSNFAAYNVHTEEGRTKVNAAKKNYRVMLIAEMNGSSKREDISAANEKAWPEFKPMAEMLVASLSGPNAFVGNATGGTNSGQRLGFDKQTGRYSEEAAKKAAARLNLLG